MKTSQLKIKINEGALTRYAHLYGNIEEQRTRFLSLIDSFISLFGDNEVKLLSVPGRSEISGNHTDHNRGCVLAGAIDRDVIALAAKNGTDKIRFFSVGYPAGEIDLCECDDAGNYEKYTTSSLIAGTVKGFRLGGYEVGGFDIAMTSDVLPGSGISSSAAFEVMIGNALNHLFNSGKIDNVEIAKIAQYAENEYFGKPCGLMDQMACAVGGFVFIDFEDPKDPTVTPIDFSLSEEGYALCIVNTGGNHADLNDDYASVPREMKDVAAELGRDVLRGISEKELIERIPSLRKSVGDRAVLRALHFIRENNRVLEARDALSEHKLADFFDIVNKSGASSFKYLQNVYTTVNVHEQGLSLALALADGYLAGEGASRVHGGGFAGTVQVFVRRERIGGLVSLMDSVFGEGSCMCLGVRPVGATCFELID
jgi:galactokinase